MADLRNFEKWDPGVTHSRMVEGTEPGADAAYLVKVKGAVLRYETKEFLPHSRTVVEAVPKLLRSYDIIDVEPSGDGCDVLYDASGCASPTTPCPMPAV